ncbi:MAG: hypothetical protein SFX73_09745 [Kofleriaceae bacterium]|nr:hypothetical protein [Kofleriaceae bacterium]
MKQLFAVGMIVVGACGSGGTDPASPDASTVGTWSPLVKKTWTLGPGDEKTSDLTVESVERDIYVGGMRPLAPAGTHHTLLYRGIEGTNMIYASGVGTGELVFPPGKGLKLTANTVLGLQLHIYNTSDAMMTGTSGIEVLELDPSTVTDEVDMFLPGPQELEIPMGTSTASGSCTVTTPYQVFALFPHMHQYGTHFKTTLTIAGQERMLHDAAYDFERQTVTTFEPIQLNPGDKVNTECTWNNTTGGVIVDGESSDTEMCYSILYRFPRGNEEFCND